MKTLVKKAFSVLQHEGAESFVAKVQRKFVHIYKTTTFKPYMIKKTIDGEEFQLLIGDLFAQELYDNSDESPELMWIRNKLLETGDVAVDCGANIGFTGLFFSRCVGPKGKVVGFEALPANAETAWKNIEINNSKNFEVRNTAVGAMPGITKFLVHPNGSVGDRDDMEVIEVPVTSLDEAFNNAPKKPTFLKIDVEGYEIEVLKGAKEVLKTRPKLDLEIHCACFSDPSSAVSEIFYLLPMSEYEAYIQLEVDGVIIPFNSVEHTPELIAKHHNVHLFAIPSY